MANEEAKTCIIDSDVQAVEIAGWLRQGLTEPTINAHLKKIDVNARAYTATQYSRHRTACLGMAKLSAGRKPKVITQSAKDIEKAMSVSAEELLRVSKAAFYDRIKRNPAEVSTRELVAVITSLTKGGKDGGGSEMDKLTEAMGDLSDETSPPEEA